jgi:uncharacterized protein YdeI (YjbR/CyaY-like superfamily)
VKVPAEDAPNIRPLDDGRETILSVQLQHLHRPEQRRRDRWMMHRDQRPVLRRRRKDAREPVELVVGQVPVVITGHCCVERNDTKPADVVDAILWRLASFDIEQLVRILQPLVVISHHPDHLRSEPRGNRFDNSAEPGVGIRFAQIGEITGENNGLRAHIRLLELRESSLEVLFGRDGAKKLGSLFEKVRVADVRDCVGGRRMLAELSHATRLELGESRERNCCLKRRCRLRETTKTPTSAVRSTLCSRFARAGRDPFASKMELTVTDEKSIEQFDDAEAFGAWLASAGPQHPGIWMKISKKGSPVTTLSYAGAVDVALAHGWIDSQRRPLDEHFSLQAFTPRRARSVWSKRNVDKVTAMIAEGSMHPAGLAEVERAKADGRWDRAYEGSTTSEPPAEFLAALDGNPAAKEFYSTLNAVNRYAIYFRLQNVKGEATRTRKIATFVDMLARGEKLH